MQYIMPQNQHYIENVGKYSSVNVLHIRCNYTLPFHFVQALMCTFIYWYFKSNPVS